MQKTPPVHFIQATDTEPTMTMFDVLAGNYNYPYKLKCQLKYFKNFSVSQYFYRRVVS